jgi:Ca2+-binding RTX toxin-like protein
MATFTYSPSTAISFNAAADVLNFTSGDASSLTFSQVGNDLRVGQGSQFMTLLGTSYANLNVTLVNITFSNGSLFRKGAVGNDTLTGGTGNDYLDIAAGGNDSASGGNGNDVIVAGSALTADDRIDGGSGSDILRIQGAYASAVAFTATTVTGVERFEISAGGIVRLTVGNGIFTGLSSAPVFDASSQVAGDGFVLDASAVTVGLNAPFGAISATGGMAADTLIGGAGSDTLTGGLGDDSLSGNAGNDSLSGEAGSDNLAGGDGNDSLNGGDSSDTLSGGAGDDLLVGGLGADLLTGGAGNDTFSFGFSSPRTDSSQTTIDTITDFASGDKLDLPGTNSLNNLPLVLVSTETAFRTDSEDFAAGSLGVRSGSNPGDGFADVLWRYSAANNRVEVWVDGNDDGQFSEVDIYAFLSSTGGKTTLSASDFADTFAAWRGTVAAEVFGASTPSINIAGHNLAWALGGNDTLSGELGTDTLYGGTGDDSLIGGDSNDQLFGGSGADTLDGGAGDDNLYAEGKDTPTTEGLDSSTSTNLLNGGAGNDYLQGGMGNDSLTGDVGNDNLNGGGGNDSLSGGADNDNVDGGDGTDTLSGGDGLDTLNGGAGADSLDGGAGNDVLYVGNSGGPRGLYIDTLVGGTGDDRLYAGESDAAVMTGGLGADRFVLASVGLDTSASSSNFAVPSNVNPYPNFSPVSAPDRITDFNASEGDLIRTGITNGIASVYNNYPLVWRGAAAAGFTATLGQSMTLATGGAAAETRFLELWTYFDATASQTGQTVLFMDRNRSGAVDDNDFKLLFDGNLVSNANVALNLSTASFTAGTFTIKVGTSGADSNTSPVLSNLADIAYGLGGNDTFSGLDGNDTLNGDAGNDSLSGGLGTDTLYGGAGNDVLSGDAGADNLYGGSGSDTINGGDDGDTLDAEGPEDATSNTSVNDSAGTLNVLNGDAGNDVLYGGAGNDSLSGGADNDDLSGGDGTDTLSGGDGLDTLNGGAGADSLDGGAGNDLLRAGNSSGTRGLYTDTLIGGASDDVLYAGESDAAVMTGGLGADRFVLTNAASDTSVSSSNFAVPSNAYPYPNFSPVSAPDRITDFNASEGDLIRSGITTGIASDYYSYPLVWRGAAAAGFTATAGQEAPGQTMGRDALQLWSYFDATANQTVLFMDRNRDGLVDVNDFKLLFDGNLVSNTNAALNLSAASFTAGTFVPAANVGTGGSDSLTGSTGNDTLVGGAGNDTLSGGDGNDNLLGDAGNDSLLGGALLDTLVGGGGDDTLDGGAADDILYASSSSTVAPDTANSYNLLRGGDGNDNLNGALGRDELYGDAGNDTLYGSDGNDSLDGGLGSDYVQGDYGDDRIVYDPLDSNVGGGYGVDLLVLPAGTAISVLNLANASDQTSGDTAVVTGFEGVDFSALGAGVSFSGTAGDEWFIGTAFADTLSGGDGNDTLDGGAGNVVDSLTGGAGSDVYRVTGADVIVEAAGGGTDRVETAASYTLGVNLEQLTLLGSDNVSGTGNELDNLLVGNAGNNQLEGGNGKDTLDGGLGSDTLVGGAGDDVYEVDDVGDLVQEAAGGGTDLVRASTSHTLANEVENLTLTGSANLSGTGNALANVLTGNAGNNTLTGGAGADTFAFAASNNGIDRITDFSGADRIMLSTASSTLSPVTTGNGSDVTAYRIQAQTVGSVTTLFIDTNHSAGAEMRIELEGAFEPGRFRLSQPSGGGQVISLNQAPTVTNPLADQSLAYNQTLSYTVPVGAFTDAEADTLNYTATRADGSTLPSWLNFSAGSRSFSASNPGVANIGSYDIKITATDIWGASNSDVFSVAVTSTNRAPTGAVTLSGTATQGQTLTAANSLADLDGIPTSGSGAIAYQWLADGVAISGATSSALVLGQALVGKALSVRASYTDNFGQAETVTSAATSVVANVNDAPTGAVSISGNASHRHSLSATNTLADVDGIPGSGAGAISYQWRANGAPISGATGSTFSPTPTQIGKVITVTASYTDLGGAVESITSPATEPIRGFREFWHDAVTRGMERPNPQALPFGQDLLMADTNYSSDLARFFGVPLEFGS